MIRDYPPYLSTLDQLRTYFDDQCRGMSTAEKGRKFAEFCIDIAARTELGRDFPRSTMRQGSHDQGIDFETVTAGSRLLAQCKYTVTSKDDIDNVLSKFQQESRRESAGQLPLFDSSDDRFQLYTLNDVSESLRRYEASNLASADFYRQLKSTGSVEIVDGRRLLAILRELYQEAYWVPDQLVLRFLRTPIRVDNIIVGVVAGAELKGMHGQYGDAIFFENIREYIRDSEVNREITETLDHNPEKFLARNNGIVMRATRIEEGQDEYSIRLFEPSIVNGCQTTKSIVEHGLTNDDCKVLVKIVIEPTSWAVARAANWQNQVGKLELEVAEFFRPQRVREIASRSGIGIAEDSSSFAAVSMMSKQQHVIKDLRTLFVGLFSKTPNNVFDQDRSSLLSQSLSDYYAQQPDGADLFDNLFEVHKAANEVLAEMREKIESDKGPMARVFKEHTVTYRAFITILACCIAIEDIKILSDEGWRPRVDLLRTIVELIEGDRRSFNIAFETAFQVIQDIPPVDADVEKQQASFYEQVKRSKFHQLYDRGMQKKRSLMNMLDKYSRREAP